MSPLEGAAVPAAAALSAQPIRLRETVEAFPSGDGRIYLLRGGTTAELVVDEPTPFDRALLELLHEPATRTELAAALAARGAEGDVDAALADLDRLGLLEPAPPRYDDRLGAEAAARYDRQLAYFADVAGVGAPAAACQERLARASVVIVGCGGLGSWTATGLACAGVGRLVLVDDDTVEVSNLNRQLLFRRDDVGARKVDAAARALRAFNPELVVERVHRRVGSASDVASLADGADLVVATADHPPYAIGRWVNDGCLRAGVPHVTAAQFPPLVRVGPLYRPGVTACLECQERAARRDFPDYDALVAYRQSRHANAATLGPASGLIGSVLSGDAVHLLTGIATPATEGRALLIDLRDLSVTAEEIQRDPECPRCGPPATIAGRSSARSSAG